MSNHVACCHPSVLSKDCSSCARFRPGEPRAETERTVVVIDASLFRQKSCSMFMGYAASKFSWSVAEPRFLRRAA